MSSFENEQEKKVREIIGEQMNFIYANFCAPFHNTEYELKEKEKRVDGIMLRISPFLNQEVILNIADALEEDADYAYERVDKALTLIKKWRGDAI